MIYNLYIPDPAYGRVDVVQMAVSDMFRKNRTLAIVGLLLVIVVFSVPFLSSENNPNDGTLEAATSGGSDNGEDTGMNGSVFADLEPAATEDFSGSAAIPLVGLNFIDTDTKDHWDMPDGMIAVVATLNWEASGWDIEFSIGTGECPDSGMIYDMDSASEGPITVEYIIGEDEEALETGQWFFHIRYDNVDQHRGDSFPYDVDIKLFDAGLSVEE